MPYIKFKDFVTLQRGFDLPNSDRNEGPYPVVASTSIHGRHDKFKVSAPGVVTGRSGSLGKVLYVDEPFWPLNTTLWVRDFKTNDPRYVFYKLASLGLERWNTGTGVPTLNRNHLDNHEVFVHTIDQQRAISTKLALLDELIQTYERQCDVLSAVARETYTSWFSDFRFPHASEHDQKLLRGTAELPPGWTRVRLSDLVSTQYGYTETATEEPVGPRFLRGMDINKKDRIDWSTVPYCPISEVDKRKYSLVAGDLLVIRMADPGKVGIVEEDIDAVFASYLVRLRARDSSLDSLFLFYLLSSPTYYLWVTGASTGTTRKSVSAKTMTEAIVLLPPSNLCAQFSERIKPLRSAITNYTQRLAYLRQIRQRLVAEMLSPMFDTNLLAEA